MSSQRKHKISVIKDEKIITDIFKKGIKYNFTLGKIIFRKSPDFEIREYAILVKKNYGNAVRRNYIKRIIRMYIKEKITLFDSENKVIFLIYEQKRLKYVELINDINKVIDEKNNSANNKIISKTNFSNLTSIM